MNDFPYTTNLKRGDDGGQVYWRALARLQRDPIASMLSEKTLKGIAEAFYSGMTDDTGSTAKFSISGIKPFAKSMLKASPMSILSDEAVNHLAQVLFTAIIVNEEEE